MTKYMMGDVFSPVAASGLAPMSIRGFQWGKLAFKNMNARIANTKTLARTTFNTPRFFDSV